MARKYSDTVIFRGNRFSDTTKQIKRFIFESVLSTGYAPKVQEIVEYFNLSEQEVRDSLHDLQGGIIVALQNEQHANIDKFMGQKLPKDAVLPKVGEIFYARPFANFKNHHRVFVGEEQRWYGECPIECMTISYFFPGQEVIVRSIAHDTGEAIEIIGKDGELLDYTPKSLHLYWGTPFSSWLSTKGYEGDLIFPCDKNYFFSSEENYNKWRKAQTGEKGQIFTPVMINHLLRMFNYGHERFDYQYHFPLLKFILASYTIGVYKIKMGIPIPNPFFLSIIKLIADLRKYGYKSFLDVKLW
ncbi:MAG: organomercurial lyase [Thermodesulfobacteriota bacterium]|nr:organomercurial lyase [Thermodesulfobacteriota bacterium]